MNEQRSSDRPNQLWRGTSADPLPDSFDHRCAEWQSIEDVRSFRRALIEGIQCLYHLDEDRVKTVEDLLARALAMSPTPSEIFFAINRLNMEDRYLAMELLKVDIVLALRDPELKKDPKLVARHVAFMLPSIGCVMDPNTEHLARAAVRG